MIGTKKVKRLIDEQIQKVIGLYPIYQANVKSLLSLENRIKTLENTINKINTPVTKKVVKSVKKKTKVKK